MTEETSTICLTHDERACLLRAARQVQQQLEAELYRLTEIAKIKGGPINGVSTTREFAAIEFSCISSATRKLWKVVSEQPRRDLSPDDG